MKKLIIALIILASTGIAHAQKINWMTWDEAVEANKKEPRLIFVDTYTDWCGWCKRMDATTFVHPEIVKFMNQHYYAVKMDAEMKDTIVFNNYTFVNPNPTGRRSTHQFAASLLDNKLSYPSFVFLNANFERLQILPGYRDAKGFEPILKYFVEGVSKGVSYEEYVKDFQGSIN